MKRLGGLSVGEWASIIVAIVVTVGMAWSFAWAVWADAVCGPRALAAGFPGHRLTPAFACYGTNLSESRRLP